jgi:hypothetical protein
VVHKSEAGWARLRANVACGQVRSWRMNHSVTPWRERSSSEPEADAVRVALASSVRMRGRQRVVIAG